MKKFSDYIDTGVAQLGTISALAARLGLSQPELSKAKNGKRGMPERACRELSNLINAPLGAIIAAREAAMAKDPTERKAWERYLAQAIKGDWCARPDSNGRPLPSEGSTLSS